jgi:y4mF family transcriptional regulator
MSMEKDALIQVAAPAEIGQLLRRKRKMQNLTLQEVSRHSGFSVRFISEVERGKPTAEIGKVLELLQVVGVDIFVRPR